MRRYGLVAALVIVTGFGGVAVGQTFGDGPGSGMGMWHGRGFMGGSSGRLDPARIEQRADRMVRHLAIEIDATPEQTEKLRGVVRSAVRDLVPLRQKFGDSRERIRTLLTQPTIDRNAIEAFRADRIALADQFSKRVAQALGDAAEILTPEQRQQVADHMARHRGFGRGWRHDRMAP